MPDLTSEQPDTPPAAPPRTTPPDDPLAGLHKMSTTAGLGSHEYVAINNAAVLALILGGLSAAVMLHPLLLIIPLAGVITGILALRQIGRSGGTQTGRGIAAVGLLLSAGFTAMAGGQQVLHYYQTRQDQDDIVAIIEQLEAHLRAGEYDRAYTLFNPQTFGQRVTQREFAERWRGVRQYAREFEYLRWNQARPIFEADRQTGLRIATALTHLKYTEWPASPTRIHFRQLPEGWVIEDMPDMFPPEPPRQML